MIRLLLGGSPCTHWSIAQTKNRETEPKGLGWELFKNYLIAREKYHPNYFLYENNKSMSPAIREQITKELGVKPILINSALVSAQSRQRLYWTDIPGVQLPADKQILLRDILDHGVAWQEKGYCLTASYDGAVAWNTLERRQRSMAAEPVNLTTDNKAHCLRASYYKDGIRNLVGNEFDTRTCIAEPIRIGTIESSTETTYDSKPYRVYSLDGKSVTLQGEAGGMGAKTGLYTVPAGAAWRGREDGTKFEMRCDQKANAVIVGHESRLVIETSKGKSYPVYEVKSGFITIREKQYSIKLKDGFYIIRKLTVNECKKLQTVPEDYIFPVSDTQAYKMLGNGWTVDVIAHILSYCPGLPTEPVEVLSMYDGMSCGHIALDKLGSDVKRYFATEIDNYAIQTTATNYPETNHLGDAFQVRDDDWEITGY